MRVCRGGGGGRETAFVFFLAYVTGEIMFNENDNEILVNTNMCYWGGGALVSR